MAIAIASHSKRGVLRPIFPTRFFLEDLGTSSFLPFSLADLNFHVPRKGNTWLALGLALQKSPFAEKERLVVPGTESRAPFQQAESSICRAREVLQ